MSGRPSIPAVTGVPEPSARVLAPMKELIERMRGLRPGMEKVKPLPPGASTNDIINKVNELIGRLQE